MEKSVLISPETLTGGPPLDIVRWQVGLGPRYPGSRGHAELRGVLAACLERYANRVIRQDFHITLRGRRVRCTNLIGLFAGSRKSGSLLLGSHFDTRLTADREECPEHRGRPIPGANDGGSGTAVLLRLLPRLRRLRSAGLEHDLLVVFFDAEDVGDIDGLPFALGARVFTARPPLPLPAKTLILDMVGGRDLKLDLDAHIYGHPPSLALTRRVLAVGRGLGLGHSCFTRTGGARFIVSDQFPFLTRGVASCLLIDLDYPAWHTLGDLPGALSEASLVTIEAVLWRYLSGWGG
jgi:glutaminyl-peptide cyclotransferase